ncbi:SCP2 sterol-binding domain-containing protein [Streptacidiphilus fuscans]|uniref:SCP2 sterol-binding domain-containing protein n=1 Tax=Streptacidiphilus fuscans TaxID=2789292 RepID=A0A931FIE4_9ACTN|nr:SCP2 sterol-binding domain-containing protein [Streptacidiphilus fuscans]MBF9071704.1 SCP2 sterol-binding domain-containing protein [Streptacidiphilus fuscans]
MADTTAAQLAELDFATVSPQEFARLVKGLSTKEIREIMRGELRLQVLRAVFGRMERQFRPDNAGHTVALIRWKVGEAAEDAETVFETAIDKGSCAVTEGRSEELPKVTLTLGDAEFLNLVSGNANPVTMFFARKLKVAGDLSLAARLTHYFDIPKA